ncbi:MAG: hypothetical protein HOQ05_11175 [Corynebacteriales bacterium]|nr:hypothetical protein [Mycobacteriales bacterium]
MPDKRPGAASKRRASRTVPSGRAARWLKRRAQGARDGVTHAPRRLWHSVRFALAGVGTVMPRPISQSGDKRRALVHVVFGITVLLVLAWFNNRQGFATATVVAAFLGLLYLFWTAYRRFALMLIAMMWWLATVPLVAVLTAAPNESTLLEEAQFGPFFVGTGCVVWLTALLNRERQPWLVIFGGWALSIVAIALALRLAADQVLFFVWALLLLYLVWRGGLHFTVTDFFRRRLRRGREYKDPTPEQLGLYEQLPKLSRAYSWLYQMAEVDAIVVGPTGTFAITALPGTGPLELGLRRKGDVTIGRVSVNPELAQVAKVVRDAAQKMDTRVTVLATADAEFPEGSHGLITADISVPGASAVPITIVRDSLLAGRLQYGVPVLSHFETSLLMHRARNLTPNAQEVGEEPGAE